MKLRNKLCKPLQHFPFVQTFIHIGFFCQLRLINNDIKKINDEYQKLTKEVIERHKIYPIIKHKMSNFYDDNNGILNKIEITQATEDDGFRKYYIDKIRVFAEMNYKAKKYQKQIMGDYFNFKKIETFLEGVPQSILQLEIALQDHKIEDVNWFTWLTISTSIISFTFTTADIFLQHPTKVDMFVK